MRKEKRKVRVQRLGREVGNLGQERPREPAAEDRAELRRVLGAPQLVKPRHQGALQRIRHGLGGSDMGVEDGGAEFFDEQRVAIASRDDLLHRVALRRRAGGEFTDEDLAVAMVQAVEPDDADIGPSAPGRDELRPRRQHRQHGNVRRRAHEPGNEFEGRRVDPVSVFEQEQKRFERRDAAYPAAQRGDGGGP